MVRTGSLTGFSVEAALGGVLTRDLASEQAFAEKTDGALVARQAVCCWGRREANGDSISESLSQLEIPDQPFQGYRKLILPRSRKPVCSS